MPPELFEDNIKLMNLEGGEVWAFLRERQLTPSLITAEMLNELVYILGSHS
jgi:hypothetical protein